MKRCFNPLECYREDWNDGKISPNIGICHGIIENNTLNKKCYRCKLMNEETQHCIENQFCCACIYFHWIMGEMGMCELRKYNNFNEIGTCYDKCSIGKFEYNDC